MFNPKIMQEEYNKYTNIKRPLSVDCCIFGYEEEQLKILLFQRIIEPERGKWSLIGGWMFEDESAEDAALRVLTYSTGLKDIYLEQVGFFSKPDRDPGGNVVTLAFNALIKIEEYQNQLDKKYGATWFPVSEVPEMIFDHNEIFNASYEKLRLKASYDLIGRQLLPEKFTLTQLRKLYDAIYQKKFDPGNFRKKVLSLPLLERLDEKDMSESKKGAFYYTFKNGHNNTQSEPIFKTSLNF